MGLFNDIANRTNAQNVDAGWWNILRAAGVAIENFLGSSYIIQTSAPIGNNQSGQNVTGLVFNNASIKAAIIDYKIRRVTSTTDRTTMGTGMTAVWNPLAAAWTITMGLEGGDSSGVIFDINASTGQVTYSTDNMSGVYDTVNSKIIFTARTFP